MPNGSVQWLPRQPWTCRIGRCHLYCSGAHQNGQQQSCIYFLIPIILLLVGKSAWNSVEFLHCSDSGHFELRNFHWNLIFPIVKCAPANSEHVPAGIESSPAIDSSDFMNQKKVPLYMSVASGIKFQDSTHQLFFARTIAITLLANSTQYTQIYEILIDVSRYWHPC